ncbi:type II toxin-antitoxin system PemK/MazF family toxin [Aneurinibacillus terranovensis]|uniref:type II toxin-antitoxin system PemK/MazF family toxin n=1 Tax=Aneurinibacillus terranovensis TaxID=278991 RepID=UPI000421C4FC|nr:type II toxin-antitoxin system PemK/MazF family toxin [Aneurinibacillus terranovensis]
MFRDKDNWFFIERGKVFQAAMYYLSDTKRPLSFFIPDNDDKYRGTIFGMDGDFSPEFKDGKYSAKEHEVIFKIKPRPVVIVSNDTNNQSDYEYVQIAPIMGLSEDDKQNGQFYTELKEDRHPLFVFLPENCTKGISKESYIDVSELTSIHKSLLLKMEGKLPNERIEMTEQRILDWLDIGEKVEDDETTPNSNSFENMK